MDIMDQFSPEDHQDLFKLREHLNNALICNTQLLNSVTLNLIDTDFIDEIKNILKHGSAVVYFGKTLRDLKIVIRDNDGIRDHEIFLQYKAPRKLLISNVKLPTTSLQNREYVCLQEVIDTFSKYINDLSRYFDELDCIDSFCSIMEPVNASFKDSYRKILLDDRTWLHVEVTPEGFVRNIHLVGQSLHWYNKLQSGLSNWDHDKNIVDNIMTIFDITYFPKVTTKPNLNEELQENTQNTLECAICLCGELPGVLSLPQPLCQNPICGVYYHRNCLYQWLVACAGNRPPAFGVANGECPRCQQPINCSEKDN